MRKACWGRFPIVWGILLAGLIAFAAPASPLKHPKRAVDGFTVDLSPLFHWWTNRAGLRPLRAWVQISGRVVATNSVGWVVEAHPEHPSAGGGVAEDGEGRIILRHPPLAEAAEFATLHAQLEELNNYRQQLEARINVLSHPHARGRGAAVVNAQLRASAQEPRMELQAVEARIKECKAQLATFPDSETFKIDCLALDVGSAHKHIPIYDYGVVRGGG